MEQAINTITGDYVQTQTQSDLQNAVYLRLVTPLGTYWADPGLGSKLHLLQREKDVSRVALLARQYAEQALQEIVKSKRAESITVDAERGNGSVQLLVTVIDKAQNSHTFKHYVSIEG